MSSFIILYCTQRLNKRGTAGQRMSNTNRLHPKISQEKILFYERRKMFTWQLTTRHLYHDDAHNDDDRDDIQFLFKVHAFNLRGVYLSAYKIFTMAPHTGQNGVICILQIKL